MVEIRFLAEGDRDSWERLARGKDAFFSVDRGGEDYERTWRRLIDDERIRGVGAWLNGRMVGNAHYLFHAGVWYSGRCYLADVFVEEDVRRRGIARAVIDWVARDAQENGYPSLYWNTLEDAEARFLYDKIARLNEGMILYSYRRDARKPVAGSLARSASSLEHYRGTERLDVITFAPAGSVTPEGLLNREQAGLAPFRAAAGRNRNPGNGRGPGRRGPVDFAGYDLRV